MSQINRVSNPSFETNTTGWTVTGATTGAPARTGGSWGRGAWYGKIEASTTGTAPVVTFGASAYAIGAHPDDRAFISVMVRADNSGAEGVRCWLRVEFWDATDTSLEVGFGPAAFLTPNAQTIYLLTSNNAPPNTAKVVASLRFEPADVVAGDQIAFDGLDVRLNEQPDAYLDGDGINASWQGTPHASPSRRLPPFIFANPKNWKSGAVLIEGKLYRCDAYGNRLDDLSRYIQKGSVTWNADKGPGDKLSGQFTLNRRRLLETYIDFLAPVLRLTWRDGTVDEKQFGLFIADIPEDSVYQSDARQVVYGLDPTWFPKNSVIRDTINYASADNVVAKMAQLIAASWPRVIFPANSRTFGEAKSMFPGRRRYDAAKDQFEAMNWYVPFPDLSGNIVTMPYRDIGQMTPAIRIDYEDFVGEWRVRPDVSTLANVVSVYKENIAGAGTPITSVAVNADPASPISTVYRPEILREITNANIQTQAEADAITLSTLQESASYYRVISGKLSPGVWMDPFCAADVFLQHPNWGNLAGRYDVRVWTVNFTQSDAEVAVEMNRRVVFGSDEDR